MKIWTTGVCAALALLAVLGCSGADSEKDGAVPGEAPVPIPHGFGDYCTLAVHECKTDLLCIMDPGAKVGFCSDYCMKQGERCGGTPPGSYAVCYLPIKTKLACDFRCGGSNRCPTSMKCDKEQPVGGGLYRCEP